MAPAQEPAEQNSDLNALESHIQASIAQGDGWISFDHYMHLALYTPELGYYSGGAPKFGEAGDFITAPEMGDLFGVCLANQVAQVFEQTRRGDLLEFGAGSGALAATMLNELARLDKLPGEYLIMEVSGQLRAQQAETIKLRAASHFERVRWLDKLPEGFCGAVVANEVLDAMPVKLFELSSDGKIDELGVSACLENAGNFCWQARPAGIALQDAVRALGIGPGNGIYRSEISLQGAAWLNSLVDALEQSVVFLFDYGFPRSEYYHPDRREGTLMCHYRHRAHADPFYKPGQQDITAHVDFTAVTLAALEAGFKPLGYANQASFLLGSGLLERIPIEASTRQQLELAQEIKKLTLPHEMGELFKVLVLAKNCQAELGGFAEQNQINRLTGI